MAQLSKHMKAVWVSPEAEDSLACLRNWERSCVASGKRVRKKLVQTEAGEPG